MIAAGGGVGVGSSRMKSVKEIEGAKGFPAEFIAECCNKMVTD
jgi:hypothetical protein